LALRKSIFVALYYSQKFITPMVCPIFSTITFATFHVHHSNFRHVTFATLPKHYNFRHVTFATFMSIYIFITNQTTQLVEINMFIDMKVAKVTWRKLCGESCVAKVVWRKLRGESCEIRGESYSALFLLIKLV
jgi:hypothetical protein